MKIDNAKALIFDFDGTLTRHEPNSYYILLRHCGVSRKICNKLFNNSLIRSPRIINLGINICSLIFKRAHISREDVGKIGRNIRLMTNTIECLQELKRQGYHLYIVSDNLLPIIEEALGENADIFDHIFAHNITWTTDGHLSKIQYMRGKVDSINSILKSSKISPSNILFFGNDENDLCVKRTGIKTCCLNPKSERVQHDNHQFWNLYLESVDDFNIVKELIYNLSSPLNTQSTTAERS